MYLSSFESEKLENLIQSKIDRLRKLEASGTDARILGSIQREIIFLRDEILPIVLRASCIEHGEIVKRFSRCVNEAVRFDCDAIAIYQPLFERRHEQPRVAIANQIEFMGNECRYDRITLFVENIDRDGLPIEPMNISILE